MIRLSDTAKLATALPNLVLWSNDLPDRILTKEAYHLPFLIWPDSRPCTPANLYMLTLRDSPGKNKQPLSRRGKKGGTIGGHAGKISQLIRFCHQKNKDFLELTDADFTNFIYILRKEKSKTNIMLNQKNENTVTETGRACIKFLMHVGNLVGKPNFVSETGTIRITFIDYVVKLRSGELKTRQMIHHHSFSAGEAGSPRAAISDETIKGLHEAIDADSTSRFVNQRRHLHLAFLEYLGPRRGELAEVTLDSINKAAKMKHPMLDMNVYKRGKPVIRQVPITNMLLSQAKKFINTQRAEVIKKFKKNGRTDHGFLFISYATGAPLADTTLTNEIHDLRRAAKIEQKACAHMFRHAFCINLFVTLFERHRIKDPDSFEIRLISDQALLDEILEWTGHASIDGLRPYIQKAYQRIANISITISAGQLALIQREFDARLEMKLSELENGRATQSDFINDVRQLISARSADLMSAEQRD